MFSRSFLSLNTNWSAAIMVISEKHFAFQVGALAVWQLTCLEQQGPRTLFSHYTTSEEAPRHSQENRQEDRHPNLPDMASVRR